MAEVVPPIQLRFISDLETRRQPTRIESNVRHVNFAEIPGCPPFSVWDMTTTEAQRYNESIRESVGEQRGETTRENTATYVGGVGERTRYTQTGSLFSPALARAVIRSYSEPGDTIFDPFASVVRPYVALAEGRSYVGCELREAERERVRAATDGQARIEGDCRTFAEHRIADLVFTCPPYWQQEIYSEDPRDLSTLVDYDAFLAAMRDVADVSYRALRGRYAVLILGDFRDWNTPRASERLVPFTADVTEVWEAAGFMRYDQINVIKVPTGFAMALCKSWNNRKTVRVHEHVVVLVKP